LDLVEYVRDASEREAREATRNRVISAAESKSNGILKKNSGKIMNEVKGHIKKARTKDRMRTVSHYLCDVCDKPIYDVKDGFVVQGNIYVADPTCRGGLIGNAFPESSIDGTIVVTDVKETVFCKACFFTALGISKGHPKLGKWDGKEWQGVRR